MKKKDILSRCLKMCVSSMPCILFFFYVFSSVVPWLFANKYLIKIEVTFKNGGNRSRTPCYKNYMFVITDDSSLRNTNFSSDNGYFPIYLYFFLSTMSDC